MSDKKAFGNLSPEQEQDYAREARLQYDPDLVRESQAKWASYNDTQKQAVIDEGNAIYDDLAVLIKAGKNPQSDEVQAIIKRWHKHLHYFYTPSLDVLRGLSELYRNDHRFAEKFEAIVAGLPDFLFEAVDLYGGELETGAIESMLDEEDGERGSAARGRLSL